MDKKDEQVISSDVYLLLTQVAWTIAVIFTSTSTIIVINQLFSERYFLKKSWVFDYL